MTFEQGKAYLVPKLPNKKIFLKRMEDPRPARYARIFGMVKSGTELLVLKWMKLDDFEQARYLREVEQAQFNVVEARK